MEIKNRPLSNIDSSPQTGAEKVGGGVISVLQAASADAANFDDPHFRLSKNDFQPPQLWTEKGAELSHPSSEEARMLKSNRLFYLFNYLCP